MMAPDCDAGGDADEVARANPNLSADVPAMVGHAAGNGGDGGGGDEGGLGFEGSSSGGEGGAGPRDETAPLLRLEDASGMDVPELAVQEGWGSGALGALACGV